MVTTDIVITWVDGSEPELQAKRAHYLGAEKDILNRNGTNPHRWLCSDELSYCLRSIANNARDIGKIWIVTDGQTPDITGLAPDFAAKIGIVDHREIFAGYEAALPTFNSLSIETFLWRIPSLAEHFVYFNDDIFVTAPVTFDDFFTDNGPVMRGKWVDFSHLPDCGNSRVDPALLNHYNQIEAAQMAGYRADKMFASAHVIHPMQRSVMAGLFDDHHDRFLRNSSFRFRSATQFSSQALHNHYCIKNGLGRIHQPRDYIHVAANTSDHWTDAQIDGVLSAAAGTDIKFICINDLPEAERRVPDTRRLIEAAIGG